MKLSSIREAAAIIGCHPYSVYVAIYEGRVRAFKLRGSIRIGEDELERLLRDKESLARRLSVAEVARILACSEATVLRLIHEHKLRAELIKGRFRMKPEDLESYVLSLPKL